MSSNTNIKYATNEIHVHKLVQAHGITYDAVYKTYGHLINPVTRMIIVDDLKINRI